VIARALVLALLAGVTGCMPTPALQPEPAKKLKPLPAYSADPFVPVNLYLNANEQAPEALSRLVQYAADRLRDSGAFVRVDQGVQRWPITLQGRYQLQEYAGDGDFARRVLGWITLGLIPVRTTQIHTLLAEVLAEPSPVARIELTVTVQDESSIYGLRDPALVEHAAAEQLLERLLNEIDQRRLIPRWAVFKPTPPKPVLDPAKPVRQPA